MLHQTILDMFYYFMHAILLDVAFCAENECGTLKQ